MRYIADMGKYAVSSYDDAAVLKRTLGLLEKQHPEAKTIPVHVLVIDPKKDELLSTIALPRVSSVTIVGSTPYELSVIMPTLDLIVSKGLKVNAIVCVNEASDYKDFIASNKIDESGGFFHSFIWPEKFEHSLRNVAVHQRVLELAFSVLAGKSPK